MDPGWPANPHQSIVCILCRAVLPFDGEVEQFFRHLIKDHGTYHNLNLVLGLCLTQPRLPGEEGGVGVMVEYTDPPIDVAEEVVDPSETHVSVMGENVVEELVQVTIDHKDIMEFDLTYLASSQPYELYVPLPPTPEDFSHLDPISIVQQAGPGRKTRKVLVNKNNRPQVLLPANPNRHLVPEDLQSLIISSNPARTVKFTHSQRLNTQLVLDDFVLKKKKGPNLSREGGRVIGWKCTEPTCAYIASTCEGEIQESGRPHCHTAQPELYARKQAYYRVKEDLASGAVEGVTGLVEDVLRETEPSHRQMLGSIDAMKQAARRYTRKLRGAAGGPRARLRSTRSTAIPAIPGLDPDSEDVQIVEEFEEGSVGDVGVVIGPDEEAVELNLSPRDVWDEFDTGVFEKCSVEPEMAERSLREVEDGSHPSKEGDSSCLLKEVEDSCPIKEVEDNCPIKEVEDRRYPAIAVDVHPPLTVEASCPIKEVEDVHPPQTVKDVRPRLRPRKPRQVRKFPL